MKKSVWISIAAIAACAALAMLLPLSSQRAVAQSGGLYINAVDLDIVPAERDNYLAAIKENSLAAIQEPGCRQFDILALADDPNHLFLYEVYDNEAAFNTPGLRTLQEIRRVDGQHGRQARDPADGGDRHQRQAALTTSRCPSNLSPAI